MSDHDTDLEQRWPNAVTPATDIKLVHVLRTGAPICPKCGKGPEADGGSVVPRDSWDWGPLWWECEDDGEQWGHA